MNPALNEIILEQTAGAKFTAAQWAVVPEAWARNLHRTGTSANGQGAAA